MRRLRRIPVFPLTRAAEKHLISEKPLFQRFFKGTGVVLAGIECSPKISDFRASGIPVQERGDVFDTLTGALYKVKPRIKHGKPIIGNLYILAYGFFEILIFKNTVGIEINLYEL